jgi:hypothetical protein
MPAKYMNREPIASFDLGYDMVVMTNNLRCPPFKSRFFD